MLIHITDFQPNQDVLLAWAHANELGHPMSIKLPITVDVDRRTITFTRVDAKPGDRDFPTGREHRATVPLILDLPEPIMAIVGMKDNEIVYPAVMV